MPKKLYAVTNIKTSLPGQEATFFQAGGELDPSKFTKEQLVELHENGAVEVRVVEAEEEVTEPEETTEAPVVTEPAAEDATEESAEESTTDEESAEDAN